MTTHDLTIRGVPANVDGRRTSHTSFFAMIAQLFCLLLTAVMTRIAFVKVLFTKSPAMNRVAQASGFLMFSLFFLPKSAWAVDEESFGGMATNLVQQGGPGTKAVIVGALIVGLVTVWAGGKKIIAASDSQGREPYGPGVVRIAVGGLFCVLSTFALFASHTFTNGNTTSVSVGSVNGVEGGD